MISPSGAFFIGAKRRHYKDSYPQYHEYPHYIFCIITDKLIDIPNRLMRRSLHPVSTNHPHYASKRTPKIKIVEVFIKSIDQKINQSYQSLLQTQQNTQETSAFSNGKPISESTQLQDPSTLFSQLSVSEESRNFETPVKQEQVVKEKEGFMKLDDSEIMEYIRMVYQKYDIQDPMEKIHALEQSQMTSRVGSTHKKLRIIKNSRQQQSCSASLKPVNTPTSCVDADAPSKSLSSNRNSTQRKGVVSLTSRKGSERSGRSLSDLTQRKNHPMTKTAKIDLGTTSIFRSHSGLYPNPLKIRYCFMCQEQILECDLKLHEEQCAPLRLAFTYDKAALIKIVDSKLERLTREVRRGLIERDEAQILAEFRGLKGKAEGWIDQLVKGELVGGVEGWSWQYSSIQQRVSSAVSDPLGVLGKIHWFGRLKHHLSEL